MRRRRRWILLFGTAVLITVAVIWWPGRGQLAVLSSPFPLEVLRIEDIGQKSMLDITLPGLGRVTYPKESNPIFGIAPSPAAININPRTAAGVIFERGHTFGFSFGSETFDRTNWNIGGVQNRTMNSHTDGLEHISCPWVFGTESREASVTTTMFNSGESATIRVRLPANGITEPKLPSLNAKLGTWSLRMEAMPWRAPAFPIRYALRVEDGKGSVFLISAAGTEGPANITEHENLLLSTMLRCTPAQPAILHVDTLNGAHGRAMTLPLKINLLVRRLVAKPTTFHVKRVVPDGESRMMITGPDGRAYATYGFDKVGCVYSLLVGLRDGVDCLRVAGQWLTHGSTFESEPGPPLDEEFAMGLRDGQVLDGVVYKFAEERKIQVTLDLPDIRRYLDVEFRG